MPKPPAKVEYGYICSEVDCLVVASSPQALLPPAHQHAKKPKFSPHQSPLLFFDSSRVITPRGLAACALRVDKHHRVAICFARQLVVPRSMVRHHVKHCSYCNKYKPGFEQDLGNVKEFFNLEYLKLQWAKWGLTALPKPLVGSWRAVYDLCLECEDWVKVDGSAAKAAHDCTHLITPKYLRCMFSVFEYNGKKVYMPVNEPLTELDTVNGKNTGDSDGMLHIDLEADSRSMPLEDVTWQEIDEDLAILDSDVEVLDATETVMVSDDESLPETRPRPVPRPSLAPGSPKLPEPTERSEDSDSEADRNRDGNVSTENGEMAVPLATCSKRQVTETELEQLTEKTTSNEVLMNRIASIAFQYIQTCSLDVFQESHSEQIRFTGMKPLSSDIDRLKHIRQFVRLITTIFRIYLRPGNLGIRFTESQEEAMEDFLDASKKVKITANCEKIFLENYENALYQGLKGRLDLDGTPGENRVVLAHAFQDSAVFGYDVAIDRAVRAVQAVMVSFMTEDQARHDLHKWNIVSAGLAVQLHDEGQPLPGDEAMAMMTQAVYNLRLVALRITMECCESNFASAMTNPWFQMASQPRDCAFFGPIYVLHDEIYLSHLGDFPSRDCVVQGRNLGFVPMSELVLALVDQLHKTFAECTFDAHGQLIRKLQAYRAKDIRSNDANASFWSAMAGNSSLEWASTVTEQVSRNWCEGNHEKHCPLLISHDEMEFDDYQWLISMFYQCEKALEELATVMYLSILTPLSLDAMAEWTWTNTVGHPRPMSIRGDKVAFRGRQRYDDTCVLPWLLSDLVLQYLAAPRKLQLNIARKLQGTAYSAKFNSQFIYDLEHFLFSGIKGRWNATDLANTVALVTQRHGSGKCITPALWRSAAKSPEWKSLGLDNLGVLLGDSYWPSARGNTLLERSDNDCIL